MRVFIGMETSGQSRRAFEARGHHVISCDMLPADDNAGPPSKDGVSGHLVGDVFAVLDWLWLEGWWPDMAIFHPTCTFHTVSAAWAFNDPDFDRYPGVGYHQKVQPGTLVGEARRKARDEAEADVKRIWSTDIDKLVIENPVGTLSKRWLKPHQIIQPYQFGDDASKKTCLWVRGLPLLVPDPAQYIAPRMVDGKPRWSNQTDSGQNNLGPSADRWKDRSKTYDGICNAFAQQWG